MSSLVAARIKTVNLHNYVQCCLDNHVLQDPYLLQCCHIYCKDCLPHLKYNLKGEYVCKLCEIPTSSDQLAWCEMMAQFLWRYQESKHEPFCMQCYTEAPSPAFKCLKCQIFLCSKQCKIKHLQLVRCTFCDIIAYNKESDVVSVNPGLYCAQHKDESLKRNCEDCMQLICLKCKLEHHSSHRIQTIAESLEEHLYHKAVLDITMMMYETMISSTVDMFKRALTNYNSRTDERMKRLLKEYDNKSEEPPEFKEEKLQIESQRDYLNHYFTEIKKLQSNQMICVSRAQEWSKQVEAHAKGKFLLQTVQDELFPQMHTLLERFTDGESPMRIMTLSEVEEHLEMLNKLNCK